MKSRSLASLGMTFLLTCHPERSEGPAFGYLTDLLLSEKKYYVYIMASRSRTLYTGITNTLRRRVWEHKQDLKEGFTKKYRIHRLVYFETFEDVKAAIRREKQIKGWRREKKEALIVATNPTWDDLAAEW